MYIQFLIIFLAIIGAWGYSVHSTPLNRDSQRKKYVIFVCILLVLQSALRNVAVGSDTYAYFVSFEDIKTSSWTQIWQNFYDVYVLGDGKDAGYPLLEKMFQTILPDYRLFLFAVAVFFFWAFGRFLYGNTNHIRDVLVGLCVYQVLFYEVYSISGIRQTIAVGFTLIGYEFIRKQKLIPFFTIIIIASLIHKSALLFLPFYYIARLKWSRQMLIGATVALPLIFPWVNRFAALLVQVSASDAYLDYLESDTKASGAHMFCAFMVLIALASIGKIKTLLANRSVEMHSIVNAFSLAIIFTPLPWVDPTLMRIVMYYSIFSIVLLPAVINCYAPQRTIRNVIIVVAIIVFCVVIIHRDGSYAFFWEEMKLGENYDNI